MGMFCPLLNNECKSDECMLYVVTNNGIILGCALTVTAKQLDKLAFYFKPDKKASTTERDPFG
jgi:hypothetical protein